MYTATTGLTASGSTLALTGPNHIAFMFVAGFSLIAAGLAFGRSIPKLRILNRS